MNLDIALPKLSVLDSEMACNSQAGVSRKCHR